MKGAQRRRCASITVWFPTMPVPSHEVDPLLPCFFILWEVVHRDSRSVTIIFITYVAWPSGYAIFTTFTFWIRRFWFCFLYRTCFVRLHFALSSWARTRNEYNNWRHSAYAILLLAAPEMSQVFGQKLPTFAPRIRRQIFSSATENRISDNKKWLADFLENFYFRVIGTLTSWPLTSNKYNIGKEQTDRHCFTFTFLEGNF